MKRLVTILLLMAALSATSDNQRKVKLVIQVEIFVENSLSDLREKAVEAFFTFAAVNSSNIPVLVDWEKARTQEKKGDTILDGKREKLMAY